MTKATIEQKTYPDGSVSLGRVLYDDDDEPANGSAMPDGKAAMLAALWTLGRPFTDDGRPKSAADALAAGAIIRQYKIEADRILDAHWGAVEALAEELMAAGTLHAPEIDAILSPFGL